MKEIRATALRKRLFELLDAVARKRERISISRFGRPVAELVPSPTLPPGKRKPLIDLDALAVICRKHGVRSLSLFGSILRDDFDEQSDVDVIVDVGKSGLGFHEQCALLDDLEALFGRRVDVLEKRHLESPNMNPDRRASIEASAREIYHAAA